MSSDRFAPAVALILSYEGGFVDDPADPGGATCYGVTRATLGAWRNRTCTVADVRELTRADVQPIYKASYWDLVRGDEIPAGVDLIVFDGAVNQGVGAITRMLQRAVKVEPDGEFGDETMKAVLALPAADLIERVRVMRVGAYRTNLQFGRFGEGWLRRVNSMAATATSWARKAAA